MYKIITPILIALFALVVTLCSMFERGDSGLESERSFLGSILTPEKVIKYGIDIDGYELIESKLKSGETMSNIMLHYGHSAAEVYRLDRIAKGIFPLRSMRAGSKLVSFIGKDSLENDRLEYVVYERDPLNYVVYQMNDSMAVYTGVKPSHSVKRLAHATIETSLWGAIMESGMPYAVGAEMEEIYQWSVDFFGIQKGDNFTVMYNEIFVEDSISIGVGQILGAKFVHNNKSHYAIPFVQDDKLEFWEEDGGSLRKQMLKAPLKYSRISSGFSNARLHPVLKVYKPHHGVDYAAPTGTPVHSVADGVVTYRANSGAGGNMIKIKHPNSIVTGYLHLSRFAKGITVGSKVKQGELIGYVGSTGISTGPHLDYRVWNAGKPVNPLKIPQRPSEPIKPENKEAFEVTKQRVMAELEGKKYVAERPNFSPAKRLIGQLEGRDEQGHDESENYM